MSWAQASQWKGSTFLKNLAAPGCEHFFLTVFEVSGSLSRRLLSYEAAVVVMVVYLVQDMKDVAGIINT